MKLDIQNLAKISKAEIVLDGITVIAGNNNTGKSTVGKVLFSFFNSLKDIKKLVKKHRETAKRVAIRRILDDYMQEKNVFDIERDVDLFHEANRLSSLNTNEILRELKKYFGKNSNNSISNEEQLQLFTLLSNRLHQMDGIDNEDLQKALIGNYWWMVFNGQLNSLQNNQFAKVDFFIKNSEFGIDFINDNCIGVEIPFDIVNKAVYVNSPYVLDRINNLSPIKRKIFSGTSDKLDTVLIQLLDKKREFNAVEDVLMQRKIQKIVTTLNQLLPGEFIRNENRTLIYQKSTYREGLNVNSLSTGLKSFAILKLLLENGALEDKDILILDEPEVHLHPEWQIIYAEVIVLLQKYFDLTVLLTTHSPYFLQAIETYSAKYEVADRCKYYLAENEGDFAAFEDVTGCTEKVYQQMLKPFEDLQSVTYGE